jgi:hypothetical protein
MNSGGARGSTREPRSVLSVTKDYRACGRSPFRIAQRLLLALSTSRVTAGTVTVGFLHFQQQIGVETADYLVLTVLLHEPL